MSEIRLKTGDLLPRVVLPDPGGAAIDLSHQAIAGQPIMFWSVARAEDAARAADLAARIGDFASVEAHVFAVATGADPGVIDAIEGAGVPQLVDGERGFAAAFGLGEEAGLVIVDASGRVVAVEPGSDFDRALAACRRFHEATEAARPLPHAPVLVLEEVFDRNACRDLIAMWESGQKVEDAIATKAGEPGRAGASLKRREDVYIADRTIYDMVGERITRRVFPEIARAFQVELASFELPRIGCYAAAEQGFFGRHRDNRTPHTAHRLFAMTCNLNTGEYDGGELRFPEFGRQLYQPGPGGAVVFSCSLLHEARPVTRGRRFGLFSFFTDAAGAAREQELIAAEKAKGRAGVAVR